MHFQHTFWLQSIRCLSLINTIFPMNIMVWWYCKVQARSQHSNWCIKVVNSHARLPCWWIILIFLSSDMIVSVSHVYFKLFTFKKKLYNPFLWMGFNCLKIKKPLQRDSLLFTTQSPGLLGTHLVGLGWIKR